jgi:hypothetical protein
VRQGPPGHLDPAIARTALGRLERLDVDLAAEYLLEAAEIPVARELVGVAVEVRAPHLDATARLDQLVAEGSALPALAGARTLSSTLNQGHIQSLSAPRPEARARRSSLAALAVALAIAAGGCGGDDEETAEPATTEAAKSLEPEDPGSPPDGEPAYEGLGTWWTKLPDEERLASAAQFIEDNPADCADLDPVDLERQTGIAYGYDFPAAARTSEVMLETCALLRDGA